MVIFLGVYCIDMYSEPTSNWALRRHQTNLGTLNDLVEKWGIYKMFHLGVSRNGTLYSQTAILVGEMVQWKWGHPICASKISSYHQFPYISLSLSIAIWNMPFCGYPLFSDTPRNCCIAIGCNGPAPLENRTVASLHVCKVGRPSYKL